MYASRRLERWLPKMSHGRRLALRVHNGEDPGAGAFVDPQPELTYGPHAVLCHASTGAARTCGRTPLVGKHG